MDARLLVAVVRSALAQGCFDVYGVLATFQEREAAVEDVWVKDLRDDPIDQPQYSILIVLNVCAMVLASSSSLSTCRAALWSTALALVPHEHSIVHFEYDL